ncbi:enhancer of mRNA-decapping protein 3 isoform X1 [Canis lupus baileyi]|uniref:Enhancer of mRNA-decapping protein 3 n=2 Tax=Canis lupus familiaris TaxID=9615 RepID=A0A8P0NJ81_CANLF|nr:enhancer of mRNA-decapping protein 3 isoform X1 [Canis lupus familiaris]XP_013965039.1 enhancer of mRNA-decapping protein 3 isoform X1 [Canis lupus familiaris]XP_013965040.1 enhancer of mRNA-decapping protein 3 isoform X1 [Canis lupus familiaris]XP_025327954.1 enhancer of mRNA-decapping protein 3 isoform X1 [Canis lupus dingo]XP_025327956.1 enhancer of mRNA-decapping protein 3 isoform X1 [Canis lupus dingo]XP_038298875.1 enhancer of mRNA-decapping protein 3 isoform X1 [Canis lupus familiari|eukprot:XP_013965038.1 enhancer of mRNA-decapping protein 3 isoform X1 [Canis lupus familiaris]
MATDWLGSIVSINCGDSLGVYQGRVSAVDQVSQTISLTRPFHNGVKCLVPEVTFRAGDITELKILEIPGPGENQHFGDLHQTELGPSGVGYQVGISQNGMGKLVKKPSSSSSAPQNIPKRTDVKSQDVAISPQQQQCSKSYVDRHTESLSQSKSFRRRHNSWSSSSRHPNQATPKKSGLKNGQMKNKDDECFGDDIEEIPDTDFDFEGNLALFDKAAVFEEIDTYERRSGTRSRGIPNERPTRYRHDENILESEPIVYRRITVPHNVSKEFCTDSGLVVPSVSYELHKKLLSVAEKHGLTLERRLEMTGVCASQMALTLLGGPNRLNPKNVHQRPTVALLCGPHVKGAQGISCGRHLANHDVQVILFLPNFVKMLESITNELSLFSKTQGQQVSNLKVLFSPADLPTSPVDLVINCLDCPENAFLRDQPWYKAAVAWANRNRAPVLSIDPPVHEGEQGIDAKWSLALGLPLPLGERAGRIYLCDIGLPQQVFQEVGISYHSPFGCKFVIPLHSA